VLTADSLSFDLGEIVWSTNHQGIGEVTLKDGPDGLGAVTVKYNGSPHSRIWSSGAKLYITAGSRDVRGARYSSDASDAFPEIAAT
jgi:hypothetical protein